MFIRRFRLLLDPNAVEGGGASTPASTVTPSTQTSAAGDAGFSPRDFDTQGQGAGSSTAATGGMGLGGVQAHAPGGAGQGMPLPADPNNRVGQTQGQAQGQANDWQSIRDAASRYGHDLSGYDKDDAAFLHLIQAAQRARSADVYSQVDRQVAPHLQQFQEWRSLLVGCCDITSASTHEPDPTAAALARSRFHLEPIPWSGILQPFRSTHRESGQSIAIA